MILWGKIKWEDIAEGRGIGIEGLICFMIDVEEDGTLRIDTDVDD